MDDCLFELLVVGIIDPASNATATATATGTGSGGTPLRSSISSSAKSGGARRHVLVCRTGPDGVATTANAVLFALANAPASRFASLEFHTAIRPAGATVLSTADFLIAAHRALLTTTATGTSTPTATSAAAAAKSSATAAAATPAPATPRPILYVSAELWPLQSSGALNSGDRELRTAFKRICGHAWSLGRRVIFF